MPTYPLYTLEIRLYPFPTTEEERMDEAKRGEEAELVLYPSSYEPFSLTFIRDPGAGLIVGFRLESHKPFHVREVSTSTNSPLF